LHFIIKDINIPAFAFTQNMHVQFDSLSWLQ
jgi:hypothetical protein